MKHLRLLTTAAFVSAVALTTAGAPAQAHGDGGRGDHTSSHGHGGHGSSHVRAGWVTVTEEATAILDTAAVTIEGSDGARVGRNRDDLIVISLGGGRHHDDSDDDSDDRTSLRGKGGWDRSSDATITLTSAAGTTEWSGFALDKSEGVITADVDGVEDVPVLTLVKTDDDDDDDDDAGQWGHHRGGSRGWGSSELQLTQASSDSLDKVVGSDAFAAGDAFATIGGGGGCRR
ncbi:hypothetical protein J2X46_001994 [Nocardioides sp. BE266]|uniref:hypothetical protein n=1 Tax=Nocardioides sp. BE266 TaxID=2817725 RepID=UPI002865F2EE|nr:hypothetical protein [Nocardioides sp. BE266]MDR7253009.1 hypothetical protein [Nocardioides sp. BE266]